MEVFTCSKCQESPEGEPSAIVDFKDGKGTTQNPFPLILCQSCAPKAYRLLVREFLK